MRSCCCVGRCTDALCEGDYGVFQYEPHVSWRYPSSAEMILSSLLMGPWREIIFKNNLALKKIWVNGFLYNRNPHRVWHRGKPRLWPEIAEWLSRPPLKPFLVPLLTLDQNTGTIFSSLINSKTQRLNQCSYHDFAYQMIEVVMLISILSKS